MPVPDAMESPAPHTQSGGGPRLFIREMVMENFKSYAGEQRVGPFHKCFSAVVGPNGSGKSNVIDAMLFVFGKRAKQMRLNKVSELIHNSTNHQNLDKARVSVHFQEILDLDDETYQAVTGSDFTITRVAFRDNSSKYYINERASTFTEVGKKLRAKGVDLDNNRFLILQGEVEQISLMKPKSQNPHDEGFLEYLEDIIGSNVYVEKIEAAHKNLEELNDKRGSVVQRVKLSEKEKDGLQGAKDQAEAYMLKEAELVKWQRRAAELASEEASVDFQRLKGRVAELEENHKKERERLEIHSKEMAQSEAHLSQQMRQRDEVEAELKACEEKFKTFERQDLKYREDLKHLKQKLKKLEEKLIKDAEKIEEVKRETEESTVSIPKLEEEIVKLTQKLGEEENILDDIRENSKVEVEKYRVQLDAVRVELEPWEKKIIECQGKIGTAESESKLLKEKHLNGRQAYERACDSIQAIKQTLIDKRKELSNMTAALDKNSLLVTSGREDEQRLSKDEDTLSAKEQGLRLRVNEIRNSMDSEKSQGVVLQAILHAKETNLIDGIHGRLGDLGAIDAKFDVAISTACSGLDYIVVETTNAAQACVELLRSKSFGVGTFLILDFEYILFHDIAYKRFEHSGLDSESFVKRLRGFVVLAEKEKQKDLIPAMNQRVQTPEGVPRLFDLVRVQDDRLRVAFFYVLGHTVVAKDLEQGSRIAYGTDRRFARVVTLDGAMFEKSGTMSGGGGKPRGGRMGTKVRDSSMSVEALHTAEAELTIVVKELAVVRERIDLAVAQHQGAERTVGKLELEIARTRMEVEAMTIQQTETSEQLGALKKAAEPKKEELARIRELDDSVEREQEKLAALEQNSNKLREKAKDLQEKLEFAGGGKVQQQKAVVEKLQKDIDKKSTAINKKKVQISTSSKTIKTLEKTIDTTNVEKAKCVEEKEQKSAEFKDIESKAFALQEDFSKIQEVFRKKCEEVDVVKKAHKEVQKVINDFRTAEVDIVAKLTDTKRLANEKERKSKDLGRRVKELSTQLQKHVEQLRMEQVEEEMVTTALEPPEACSLQRANQNVAVLEAQLKEMTPSLDAIAEYRLKAAQYDERVNELNAVTEERDDIKRQYDELRKKRLDDFMSGFNTISLKLKEMYQMITLGGDAELELVDSLDPFAEGVVFSVRPPKKSWKNIANLSGGEKTLSSLALVFALHHYKPTPLYVMDEIDAALDFKNVSIVGHYIKDRTKNAQFVIISLRNNMFELADRLIGIYKTDNCTKSITINPKSFAVPAAEG